MDRRTFLGFATFGVLGMATGVAAQGGPPPGKGPRWSHQAEKDLGLAKGTGAKLMTEAEWKEHHEKMRTLKGDEREKYRRETHAKMVERAKERGVTIPPEPGPHGRGKGGGGSAPPATR